MDIIFDITNKIFEILFYPVKYIHPMWGIVLISLITSIIILIVFRFTSNQHGIKKAKTRISAYILEMRLFSHDLDKMFLSLGRVLIANFFYLRYMVIPFIFIIIPLSIILIQMSYRYEYRPLKPGEETIIKAVLKPDLPILKYPVILQVPKNITIRTPALRITSLNEINWRISGRKRGIYELKFIVNGKQYKKNLHIDGGLVALSTKKVGSSFFAFLLNHYEPKLPYNSPFKSIQIIYPHRTLTILGLDIHWIIWFLIFSIIFTFTFKNIFQVEL